MLADARTGAVVGATRPIAGRLAALGKAGSLRSLHLHTVRAGRPLRRLWSELWAVALAGLRGVHSRSLIPRRASAWDVPDDARFARNSPGCSLTLAPGLSSGPPGRSPGASLRSEKPGRCAPIHWLATGVTQRSQLT